MDRKTLSWERCDICGRHGPVRECTLKPGLMVCPSCCLSCPLRDKCPKPAWFPELKRSVKQKSKTKKQASRRSRGILSYIEE
ncbi:MAG: hypothetical protein GSR75_02665 [Desulfurococcales archaeon]|nr:hypothetical protein [Desulfurococcales archaeon]